MKKEQKTWIIILVVLVVVFVAIISWFLSSAFIQTDPVLEDETKVIGLLNDGTTGAKTPQSAEERNVEESSKPIIPENVQSNIDQSILNYLSNGNFAALSSYLADIAETYQGNSDLQAIRNDVATTLNLTAETATAYLWRYQTSEVLAATMAYTPIQYRLNAYVNLDSLVFPDQTGRNINLKIDDDVTEEDKKAFLDEKNEGKLSFEQYLDVEVYSMKLNGLSCQLWAVKMEDGWVTYQINQKTKYTVSFMNVQEAQKINAGLYNTNSTIDGIMSFSDFDEEAYLKDMEEHPELYNPDGSIKKSVLDDKKSNQTNQSSNNMPGVKQTETPLLDEANNANEDPKETVLPTIDPRDM